MYSRWKSRITGKGAFWILGVLASWRAILIRGLCTFISFARTASSRPGRTFIPKLDEEDQFKRSGGKDWVPKQLIIYSLGQIASSGKPARLLGRFVYFPI